MTTIEAFGLRGFGAEPTLWRKQFEGTGGPMVASGGQVIAALGGSGRVAEIALRGEPGAVVVALAAASGAPAWQVAIDATQWSVIAALAATRDGAIVGGSFAGTLRIGNAVVSSAGRSDGFVARLTATGAVAWLIRVGGPGADAVQGVAVAGERIAVAGTFAAGADLRGHRLAPFDERSLAADGFVAELDGAGQVRWVDSFGGKADDSVAGVAIDGRGQVAVAAGLRETVRAAAADLVADGPGDGMVLWWSPAGVPGGSIVLGGAEFDGLRAIAAVGDRVVAAGFYSGSIKLGGQVWTAAGGDDAFVVALDATGRIAQAWPVTGEGREEITAIAAIPGGFVAGIAHTAAARIAGAALPAPRDPLSGAALVVVPIR
jgi:hypothetical protein